MGWSVEIRGATTLAIDANLLWRCNVDLRPLGMNLIDSVDWKVDIEGELVNENDDAEAMGATFFEYLSRVADTFQPVEVAILQNGIERRVLKPEDGFVGPFVTNFHSDARESGNGESKMDYAFTILYKSIGGQEKGDKPTYGTITSLETTKKNGKVVRLVWKASVLSTDAATAERAIKSLKPSETFITEQIEVSFGSEPKATGVWVWDFEAKGVVLWKCKVTWTGGTGFIYIPGAHPKVKPLRCVKQAKQFYIHVDGEIIAFTKDIAPPAPHFKESDDIVREPELEPVQDGPEIHNRELGQYRLEYHEVYSSLRGVGPAPSHSGDHNLIDPGQAPAKGAIAR